MYKDAILGMDTLMKTPQSNKRPIRGLFELLTGRVYRGLPYLPEKRRRRCGKRATAYCSVTGKNAGCKTLGGEAHIWGGKKRISLEKSGREGSHSSYSGGGRFQVVDTFFFCINFLTVMLIYYRCNQ